MTKNDIKNMLDKYGVTELEFKGGVCNDCKKEVSVFVSEHLPGNGGDMTEMTVTGGAVYQPDAMQEEFFVKCDECFARNPELNFFKKCDVYSRVVGYLQPVRKWNPGKQAEWKDREMFDKDKALAA